MKHTIRLSAMDAVEVEPVGQRGIIEMRFVVGGVALARKPLSFSQASELCRALSAALDEAALAVARA